MKKLFLSILVICSFLGGNAYAKDIWLDCVYIAKTGHSGFSHSFIINEKEKKLQMDGLLQTVIEFDQRYILFFDPNESDILQDGRRIQTLDRMTGVYDQKYKCKVINKTVF